MILENHNIMMINWLCQMIKNVINHKPHLKNNNKSYKFILRLFISFNLYGVKRKYLLDFLSLVIPNKNI